MWNTWQAAFSPAFSASKTEREVKLCKVSEMFYKLSEDYVNLLYYATFNISLNILV